MGGVRFSKHRASIPIGAVQTVITNNSPYWAWVGPPYSGGAGVTVAFPSDWGACRGGLLGPRPVRLDSGALRLGLGGGLMSILCVERKDQASH